MDFKNWLFLTEAFELPYSAYKEIVDWLLGVASKKRFEYESKTFKLDLTGTRFSFLHDNKNNPDINELTEYNKTGMTIVLPDNGASPANPSGIVSRASGCQMVAMRYQLVDNNLMQNALFFDRAGYAFALKPVELRYQPVTVPAPTPQLPEYSYATRNSSTDYYSFNF